jgi:hypothetical protein
MVACGSDQNWSDWCALQQFTLTRRPGVYNQRFRKSAAQSMGGSGNSARFFYDRQARVSNLRPRPCSALIVASPNYVSYFCIYEHSEGLHDGQQANRLTDDPVQHGGLRQQLQRHDHGGRTELKNDRNLFRPGDIDAGRGRRSSKNMGVSLSQRLK